jgi:hypothetical protein
MAQIRGTAGYHLGNQGTGMRAPTNDATNDPSPLDAIKEQTGKIEEWLDTISEPIKPYVQQLATPLRLLLGEDLGMAFVVTGYADSVCDCLDIFLRSADFSSLSHSLRMH